MEAYLAIAKAARERAEKEKRDRDKEPDFEQMTSGIRTFAVPNTRKK